MNYEQNEKMVPVICVMEDHIRLSEEDCRELFGTTDLPKLKDLGQEGEWISTKKLFVEMESGKHAEVSVIMPCVNRTEVCLCSSTVAMLGGKADLVAPNRRANSTRIAIENPEPGNNGFITRNNAVKRLLRHIHLPKEIRDVYGIELNDTVIAEVNGKRGVILDQVVVVNSENKLGKELELHVDKDEGFAFGVFEDLTYAKIYVKKK
jgi:propanediol utilization protein